MNNIKSSLMAALILAGAASAAGQSAGFTVNGGIASYTAGPVGIGTTAPAHRLGIKGGPVWTSNKWGGAIDLEAGSAIGWHANSTSRSFGMGYSNGGFFMFRTASAPGDPNAPATYEFVLNDAGHVGIGTSQPASTLTVFTAPTTGSPAAAGSRDSISATRTPLRIGVGYGIEHTDGLVRLTTYVGGTGMIGTRSNHPLQLFANDQLQGNLTIDTTGRVGIGTDKPGTALEVSGKGTVESTIVSTNERAILGLRSTIRGGTHTWTIENGVFGSPGLFGIFNRSTGRVGLTIDANSLVSVDALQIKGGSDLAENFDVSPAPSDQAEAGGVESGMVVSIDPAHPGKLLVSSNAYDRRVAGIVSGAGGVHAGMMMGQPGTLANGAHAVALTGRVYCWADATNAPVEVGDLLTTSDIPGHAMTATDRGRASGAILGKAMSGLARGRGMVLVLVTLQ